MQTKRDFITRRGAESSSHARRLSEVNGLQLQQLIFIFLLLFSLPLVFVSFFFFPGVFFNRADLVIHLSCTDAEVQHNTGLIPVQVQ